MVQVINDPNRKTIGESAVSGLSSLLQGLAQSKAQDLHTNRAIKELKSAYPELPEGALGFLAKQPPKEQQMYLQSFAQNLENMKLQQRQQQELQEAMRNQALQQLQFKQQQPTVPYAPTYQGPKQPEYGGKQQAETQQLIQTLQRQPVQQAAQSEQPSLSKSTASLGKAGITPYQQARLNFEQQKEKRQEEKFAIQQNKDYIKNVYDTDKAKNEEDNVLKRIIHVSEKDDTRNPVLSSIMGQLGIDYQGLKNGDTLELDKLSRWFLRGGVKMFGGRVSNAEMNVLLQMVPNILQTKEGRIRLAKQMLLANQDFHDEAKVMQDILRENKGLPPQNLRFLAEEQLSPIREKNANAFIKGIDDITSLSMFKVGQKVTGGSLSRLPDGAEVTKGGKQYIIKNGKPIPKR